MNLEFPLGGKANAYIRDRLLNGWTLSKLLGESINLEHGRAWTYLPKSVNLEEALKFDQGGKITSAEPPFSTLNRDGTKSLVVPVSSNFRDVVPVLQKFLSLDSKRVLVCEDYLRNKSDFESDALPAHVRFFQDEVYSVLPSSQATIQGITDAFTYAASFRDLGLVCSADLHGRELSREDLNAIVQTLCLLVVEAYDGEGFLIWERSNR